MDQMACRPLRPLAALSLAFVLAAALACTGDPPPERVVLISIDTLRADRVGAFGAGAGRTPTLDAIAARGVRFSQAISPVPLTLPAHATLLTGRAPYQHGVHHNGVYRLGDDVPTLAERMRDAGFATAAFVGAFVLDRQFGLARGFERYDDRMLAATHARGALQVSERTADAVVAAAVAWLQEAPRRFLLFVHLYDPHAEYAPPAPFATRFPDDPYAGEIAFADAQLGILLEAVERRFPDGRTLVAVVSDHGESLHEHGEPTHAYALYDATQRVPFLLAGPGLPEDRAVDDLVRLEDVTPSLLALLALPEFDGIAGRSVVPLLEGRAEPPRVAYLETLAPRLDFGWSALYGVRNARWKYLRAPRPELYDLASDPGETRNLAGENLDQRAALDAQLSGLLASAAATAPTHAVDPIQRAQLELLGYVVSGRDAAPVPLGEVGGPDPKDEMPRIAALHEANGLLGRDRPREALARLEGLPARGAEFHRVRAMAALSVGDLALAEASARAAIEEAPELEFGHLLLGQTQERAGAVDEAAASYRRAAELAPGLGQATVGLGRLAEGRGDRAGAAAHYRQAREARAPSPEATWRLAALRFEDGARDEAFALLAELPASAILQPAAALRLAVAERESGRTDLARLRVDGALRAHPGSVSLLRLRASLLEENGDQAGALAARERAWALDPADPAVLNDLAWSLASAGRDLDRALALARGAVAAAGEVPPILHTLAVVLVARGERAEAERVIAKALPQADEDLRAELIALREKGAAP